MQIEYYGKDVYGTERFYIKDAQQAAAWEALTKRKTMDFADMINMTNFGVAFKKVDR